ncbi:12892_t:CDS:2, partial [Cetraspora pellucida]
MIKRSNRTTRAYVSVPKLHIKSKKTKYEDIEETSVSDETAENSNAESIGLHSEVETTIDNENVNNCQPSYKPLVDTMEVLIDYSVNPTYDIIGNEQLLDIANIPEDNEESDVTEFSISDVLEDSDESDFTKVSETDLAVVKKSNSTSTYEDLVKILKHPKFKREDVSTNIRQIWKWRNRLPLVKVVQHNVPLSGDFLMYHEQSSISICRVRGVVVDKTDNNSLKLKVDRIISHKDLPNIRPTDNRHIRGNGKELWLIEGETNLVNPANIERHVNVWLLLQEITRLENGLAMTTLLGNTWVV